MKNIFRSPIAWSIAIIASSFCYYFAFHFFPKTFPIVNLAITMDLKDALKDAALLAERGHYGPQEYRQAALFNTDNSAKTFIEREGGGVDALVTMMKNNLYIPYVWHVRHFKEGEQNETLIKFTPDGKPYGLVETISENNPGAQLTEAHARTIAQKEAQDNWNIDFTNYELVEASQKVQPSDRIDHTFIYERTDASLHEGKYRLKIQVSGDKVSEVTRYIKIPESFVRRHGELRSANTMIAFIALIIVGLLYFFGGCIFGIYWLVKRRWHLWKQALLWGIVIGLMPILLTINQLPSLWMYYNTAQSLNGFLIQKMIASIINCTAMIAPYTLIIMTAESLTRRAFGNHPQLWSVWFPHNSASSAVIGRTLGAYLCVGFLTAFVVAFYLFSTNYLSWWNPSDILFDPNILATYFPWLSPLISSLHAGFIEECLFRAVPLAGAALIGEKYGKKNLWISGAFILQALVFGAAHATYPTLPSYSRVIELIIPSFIFGALYLRFGLLSTIITHTVYDIIWFSIPIFNATSSSALLSKIIILICSAIPLLIILYGIVKRKKIESFSDAQRNLSWEPPVEAKPAHTPIVEMLHDNSHHNLSRKKQAIIVIAGILSAIAWCFITPFYHDGVKITETSEQAIVSANTLLRTKNVNLSSSWYTLPLFFNHYNDVPSLQMQHRYIWKIGNKDIYHDLLKTHLEPAHWTVRYTNFNGNIMERAEAHMVLLYDTGRHFHIVPESTIGATLTKEEARIIAHKTIENSFNLDPAKLIEISAVEYQRPHRKDWIFTFADTDIYSLTTGQARVVIAIAGDEVVDTARIIHVPEEWQRTEYNNAQQLSIISMILIIMIFLIAMIGFYIGRLKSTVFSQQSAISKKLFTYSAIALSTIVAIKIANSWPSIIGSCNTIEPLYNQLIRAFSSSIITECIKAVAFAFVFCMILAKKERSNLAYNTLTIATGFALGICASTAMKFAQTILPLLQPLWPDYSPLGGAFPLIGSFMQGFFGYIQTTLYFLTMTLFINAATSHWSNNRLIFSLLFILWGLSMSHLSSLSMIPLWLLTGTAFGAIMLSLYALVIAHNSALIPLITGAYCIMHWIQQGAFNAFPCALFGAISNIFIILCLSLVWFYYMNQNKNMQISKAKL